MTYDAEYIQRLRPDTGIFKITSLSFSDSAVSKKVKPKFKFEFSHPFIWNEQEYIGLFLDGNHVATEIKQTSPKSIVLEPKKELLLSKEYRIKARFKRLKNLWGNTVQDSLINCRIYSPDKKDFGWLTFQTKSKRDSLNIILYSTSNPNKPYKTTRIKANTMHEVTHMKGGNYILHFFHDQDGNGTLSSGQLKPLTFSEPFYMYPDTIHIRSRWEQEIKQPIDVGF